MQRITRYPLLIRQVNLFPWLSAETDVFQILQYTEPGQDRIDIERALEEVERVLGQVNEAIRDQEGRERLKAISANLWIGQG